MLFHFLNFSQCVCLGIKRSTNLKVHSKGRYIVFFFFLSLQELQRMARLDYKYVFLYL